MNVCSGKLSGKRRDEPFRYPGFRPLVNSFTISHQDDGNFRQALVTLGPQVFANRQTVYSRQAVLEYHQLGRRSICHLQRGGPVRCVESLNSFDCARLRDEHRHARIGDAHEDGGILHRWRCSGNGRIAAAVLARQWLGGLQFNDLTVGGGKNLHGRSCFPQAVFNGLHDLIKLIIRAAWVMVSKHQVFDFRHLADFGHIFHRAVPPSPSWFHTPRP